MEVKIVHSRDSQKDIYKDRLIESITTRAAKFLTLPEIVIIELKKLNPSNYGETDITSKKIILNCDIDLHSIIFPLSHELLHLEQIETGRLNRSRSGKYVWENVVFEVEESITYSHYKDLPWELDVNKKHYELVAKILKK